MVCIIILNSSARALSYDIVAHSPGLHRTEWTHALHSLCSHVFCQHSPPPPLSFLLSKKHGWLLCLRSVQLLPPVMIPHLAEMAWHDGNDYPWCNLPRSCHCWLVRCLAGDDQDTSWPRKMIYLCHGTSTTYTLVQQRRKTTCKWFGWLFWFAFLGLTVCGAGRLHYTKLHLSEVVS